MDFNFFYEHSSFAGASGACPAPGGAKAPVKFLDPAPGGGFAQAKLLGPAPGGDFAPASFWGPASSSRQSFQAPPPAGLCPG